MFGSQKRDETERGDVISEDRFCGFNNKKIILVVNWKQRKKFHSAGDAKYNGGQGALGLDETMPCLILWIRKLSRGLCNLQNGMPEPKGQRVDKSLGGMITSQPDMKVARLLGSPSAAPATA
jgi:hypothetical protein